MCIRDRYKEIDIRYIVHDAAAKEVDQHTFYHLREGGGTKISSAYQLCSEMMKYRYPYDEWNIYAFHFSDGDNWGNDDTRRCVEILLHDIIPNCNQFCYGQVRSAYGSGRFAYDLLRVFEDDENIVVSEINRREEIYDAIKSFLGKGR